MFPAVLYRFLFLRLIFRFECLWAAVPRRTDLDLETRVSPRTSPFPIFSGDKVTLYITISHTSKSQAKAVDGLLELQIPYYLKVLSYGFGDGLPSSSVDKSEFSKIKFKFDNIRLGKSVTLSLIVAVDPYFTPNHNKDYHVAVLVNFWYYGEDGPCTRPPSLYNAHHVTGRLPIKFLSTTACEKQIDLPYSSYSASSVSSSGFANNASFSSPGLWLTADSLKTDKSQFLQLDLLKLMRVFKIASRGQTTPWVAFVRTYHVYYSKNSVEWSASLENGDVKVFQANTDGSNVVFNFMPSLTHATYLRIVPKSWKRRQALDVAVFGCNVHPNADLVDYCPIFDFENGVAGWEKTGTAFDNQPTIGDNYEVRKGKSANIQGNVWIATAEDRMRSHLPAGVTQGDTPVGTLTSPKFPIVSSKLYFLIGGTVNNTNVRAELLIDGKSVRKASGNEEKMTEITWYVEAFRGKEAVLRLVDDSDAEHLNFDALRMDCFLDADAQEISLPSRAAMLNTRTHSFYVCDSSHLRRKDVAICRMTSASSDRWFDIPDILGLLGIDKSTHQLYAVSNDHHVLKSIHPAGGNWQYIKRSEWDEVKGKASVVRMTSLPLVAVQDGVPEEVLKDFSDSNSDQWRASSRGIAFKPAGRPWMEIAAWSCHTSDVIDDPCFSEPCENHANCTALTRDQYICNCVPGYSGVNCETDIDECLNVNCLNGGTCINGMNSYFCRCSPGFTGDHCENVLPTCRTSPCLNGGTCSDGTPPSFRCVCTTHYKGTYCEIEKNSCMDQYCSNGGVCVPKTGGYQCVCPYGFTGHKCDNAIKETNFEIVATRSVTETNTYLVIKARIPSHGESFTESWCRDYTNLCSDGKDPTGFGRSYNHIREYASCQERYFSVMDRGNVLGATPNEKVAALAQQAGFSGATSTNSFAFNACDGRKCSRILPESGCDEALTCISKSVPNLEVYTVCIEPDSQFRAVRKQWDIDNGRKLALLTVKSGSAYSKHATWCRDYEVLCDRYGMRAVGSSKDKHCVEKYRAIVIQEGMRISQFYDPLGLSNGFLFKDCSSCGSYSYDGSTYEAMYYFKHYYSTFATACAEPQGIGFKVLDDKKLASYNDKDYTAIKVQVPLNGKSSDTNWCKDYQLLCQSYNMAPLGCADCVSKYDSSFTTCPMSTNEIEQLIHLAGFSEATSSNTFIYKSCRACSSQVLENECQTNDLFCLQEANSHRVFYTMCVAKKESVLQVKSSRRIVYHSLPYTVIQLFYLPEDGQPLLDNWCEEYQALCQSVGGRPVSCGPSYLSHPDIATCSSSYGSLANDDGLLCGDNSVLIDMVNEAGFYNSWWENTFMFHNCSSQACSTPLTYSCNANCSCHPALGCLHNEMSYYSRESFTICSDYTSAFKVLETKDSEYEGHAVLAIKAQIPSNGKAVLQNWCEEYKMMCNYYGYRPTGCGVDYADDINYASCRYDYESVMPTDNVYGCPATTKVALIAKSAGFPAATASNSFAFSNCTATCVSSLTVNGPFIDLSVADGVVYTICETSDSNFKVTSSTKSVYKGGEYLFVEALVPQDLISKHDTWCTDYQRMCESFGLKPVIKSAKETDEDYATCRKLHGPINTKLQEATHPSAIETFGEAFLGYSGMQNGYNIFVFGTGCDTDCSNDMNDIQHSLEGLDGYYVSYSCDYKVFTVCASSDSNFHVLSTKTIKYQMEDYLVIMAKLPTHREAKYENWCRDYERLCQSFGKRATGCGLSYQWSSKYRTCVDKYQSAMANNDPVGCNSSQTIANIANMAGYTLANQDNSFAFHQCDNECPKKLIDSCPDSLPCLNSRSDVVYTVCTDSSSAFEVKHVLNTWEGNVPLLFITTTLNGAVDAKSGDWCKDYQKLCMSYAARPVGCYSANPNNDVSACSKDYNAVPLQSDVNQCGDNGVNDLSRIREMTPTLSDGALFKCHKCKSRDCKKTLSDSCNGALNCLTQQEWVYTICSRASHNFDIIDTKTTSHGELEDVVVIHANIPMDGRSLYDNWCEDYTKMCSVYDKVPLACPLHPNYTAESAYRACSKDYNGYMMRKYETGNTSTLPCPLNDLISDIAQQAGFKDASSANALGLTTCLSCSKTLQNVSGESYISMSCPPNRVCTPWQGALSNRDVYVLCVKPQNSTSFHINEIRHIKHRDRKYAVVRVSLPYGTTSIFNDWCADYQKVCESISMRPITCGKTYQRMASRRLCRSKYNAVMPRGFDCPSSESIADIARAAGFHYNTDRVFSLNDCNKCRAEIDVSEGLDRISDTEDFYYTACTYSDSNFEVLQTRDVVINDKSFLVVKAQLPADMFSSHESWCKDYQMMCESYGKRPLTCSDLVDVQSSYNALLLDHNCESLSTIPQQAGFIDATEDNTFVFKYYSKDKCLRGFPDTNGPFGKLNSSVVHRQLYTVCLNSATAFEVLATRSSQSSNGRTYLFLQVAIPEDGKAKYDSWCHDYTQLCREYAKRPVSCKGSYSCKEKFGAIHLSEDVCPVEKMHSFAENAGISTNTHETNFLLSSDCWSRDCEKVVETRNCTGRGKKIPECFDRDVNDGEFTTVCVTPADRTRFPTLDVKYVKYSGRRYTVIRTQKTHEESVQSNWCYDYHQLCLSFTQKPLACPMKYNADSDLHLCRRSYGAVSMESNEQGCPMNRFVAELAQHAGFTRATPQNSFAFQNCHSSECLKRLPTNECSQALFCLNMVGDQNDLYTACTDSDSAFKVLSYKNDVSYNGLKYGVIKVAVDEGDMSAHEDWCKDYQRLCESFYKEAVQCERSGLERSSDICTNNYGAHQRLSSCAAGAKEIATKANIGHVADKTALIMDGCKSCPTVVTKHCSTALNCLRSSILYAVCAETREVHAFKPMQTRFVNYGNRLYLLIQSNLRNRYSRNFKSDYENLCKNIYGYQAIGCGRAARGSYYKNNYCYRDFPNSLSHQGDDFICPPAKTIWFLAKQCGFHQATLQNSFAFYQCRQYQYYNYYRGGYELSTTSCYKRLWCLKFNNDPRLYYTMCAVPLPSTSLGFHVLDKKEFTFLGINYLAFKLSIGSSGDSATDNWCFDYRELCRRYNMVPTGCGSAKKNDPDYFSCSSTYKSFMSRRNSLGCGSTSVPSSLIRRAGFPDAVKENTFVFNDCSQCTKKLQPATCDPALNCLHSNVFNTHAYTLCVERKSGFEYMSEKKTIYGGVEYLVVKSALPVDNRPLYDNWCVDYQRLCYSVGAFPVACSLGSGVRDVRRFAEKYGAITVDSIPCPPIARVLAIVKKAGFSTAKAGNSFVFTGYSSYECSKNLPNAHCSPGLDCLNSQSKEVFAVCINPTNFAVSDVRTTQHSGNTFTVIEAKLPPTGLSKTLTWCEEYATLCRAMKQRPIVCPGYVDPSQYEKCSDSYDGYLLLDQYSCTTEGKDISEIAQIAGFAEASFANTFGLSSCSSCKREFNLECDPSLGCINNQTAGGRVYALCVKDEKDTNLRVLATKEVMTSQVQYQVVKAAVSESGRSKYDTWCKDYERMCSSLEMRPIRCSSDGNTCPLLYKSLVSLQEQFSCDNNSALVRFVHNAGFSEASQDNTFIYSACSTSDKCRKTLVANQCDPSMNCLKKPSDSHVIFTLCARSRSTNFKYLDSRTHIHNGVRYFVVIAGLFSPEAKNVNWCYDYRDMCVSFGKQPVVYGDFGQHSNEDRNQCFAAYNATSTMEFITSYNVAAKELSTPFSHCRVVYMYCKSCVKTFDHCPFDGNCNCDRFYLFCL